jgi:hypothetical protein
MKILSVLLPSTKDAVLTEDTISEANDKNADDFTKK